MAAPYDPNTDPITRMIPVKRNGVTRWRYATEEQLTAHRLDEARARAHARLAGRAGRR